MVVVVTVMEEKKTMNADQPNTLVIEFNYIITTHLYALFSGSTKPDNQRHAARGLHHLAEGRKCVAEERPCLLRRQQRHVFCRRFHLDLARNQHNEDCRLPDVQPVLQSERHRDCGFCQCLQHWLYRLHCGKQAVYYDKWYIHNLSRSWSLCPPTVSFSNGLQIILRLNMHLTSGFPILPLGFVWK